MPRRDETFIDQAVAGRLDGDLEDHLDRFVERWHRDGGDEVPLHEFLGMSWQEYQWTATDGGLAELVQRRRAAQGR